MSLSTASNRVVATGDGVTVTFYFNLLLYDATHLEVYVAGTLATSGYTVNGVPGTATSVTFSVAPVNGAQVILLRVVPLTQLSRYQVGGAFPAETTEKNFDLAFMALQQFDEINDRAVTLPVTSTLTAADIPDPALPANYGKGLKIKGDGSGLDTFDMSATPYTSQLTTKGDIAIYSTTSDRLPVGTDGQFIVADSTAGPGAKWTGDVPDSVLRITGSSDATKKVALEVDALTTATTRTRFQINEDSSQGQGWELLNTTLTATVAANALTVALKTKNGTDPSATDPIIVKFRNASSGSGDYASVLITSALSLAVSSGSTLGTTNGTASRLYVGIANDGGTPRLFVYNPLNASTLTLIGLAPDLLYSSTAEGGAGAADSSQVLYSGTAFTTRSIRVIGYVESTQATAGTWVTTPSKIHLLMAGIPATGTVIQSALNKSSASATGTTTIPNDDTIPQITEGDEYMTQAITPSSAINLLTIEHVGIYASSAAGTMSCALFQGATADALAAIMEGLAGAGSATLFAFAHTMQAGTTSLTTFRIRAGNAAAGTTTFNGFGGVRKLGGVMASRLVVTEVMV